MQNQGHHWSKNSAYHKITNKVPVVLSSYTLRDVRSFLERSITQLQTIDYIYVIDESKKLLGVFSIKEMYQSAPEAKAGEVAKKQTLITALPSVKLPEIANLAVQHNIKSVPIVDERGIFLGIISSDTILQVLNREHRRILLRLAGIHEEHLAYDNVLEIPFSRAIQHRIPWLLIGLGGGIFVAQIIGYFEHTLRQHIVLAAFIPLVVYIADAVSVQLESFAIRDLALYRKIDFSKYFWKQFLTVSLIALILGLVIAAASFALYANTNIAAVLGAAIAAAVLSSLLTGLFFPFLFRRFQLDPANASGPIAAIIQDILSITIYFAIASVVL